MAGSPARAGPMALRSVRLREVSYPGVTVVGVELAAGYLFAWAVRKARRAAGRADAEVDRALDAAMDRLHETVAARLGSDPALERTVEEAASGRAEPMPRTRQRLELALQDATGRDTAFADALAGIVAELQSLSRTADQAGGRNMVRENTFNAPTAIQTGDHNRQDNHFGPR